MKLIKTLLCFGALSTASTAGAAPVFFEADGFGARSCAEFHSAYEAARSSGTLWENSSGEYANWRYYLQGLRYGARLGGAKADLLAPYGYYPEQGFVYILDTRCFASPDLSVADAIYMVLPTYLSGDSQPRTGTPTPEEVRAATETAEVNRDRQRTETLRQVTYVMVSAACAVIVLFGAKSLLSSG